MRIFKWILVVSLCLFSLVLSAQPAPCTGEPAMSSTCANACVICDIDGFTGVNNQTGQGQGFDGFCTTQFNKMQYIAFIAGSENITIEIVVTNCLTILGLEVGFFRSDDCETFVHITECDTDIPSNTTRTFTNIVPLVIGQHYYLVMDGSNGATCDWTFNVVSGSTQVDQLDATPAIVNNPFGCVDEPVSFECDPLEGAAFYTWRVNGMQQQLTTGSQSLLTFTQEGFYEVCASAENACDEADESCTTIQVFAPTQTNIDTVLCFGECIDVAGNILCNTGSGNYNTPDQYGCDSLISIDLEVLDQPSVDIDINLCNGEFFQVGDQFYSTTGIFSTTVLTALQCDSIVNLDLFIVECEISGSTSSLQPICAGESTGTLIFSLDNGTPPFTYDYSHITDPSIAGTGNTVLFQDNEITGVPAGIYEINVFDTFGNDVVVFAEVTDPPVLNASVVPVDMNGFNVSCSDGMDGEITAFPTGGIPPYTYEWSEGSVTATASNLAAQEYTVSVIDAYGCVETSTTTLSAPAPLNPNINFLDPNCDGFDTGIISVETMDGGIGPYLYGLSSSELSTSETFSGLSPGFYEFYIQDANGCMTFVGEELVAPDIPIIELGDALEVDLGESISIFPFTNGSDLVSITWVDSSSLDCGSCLDVNATPFQDATYQLTVVSKDDCSTSDQVLVRVNKIRNVYIPNIFSPNDDGFNDRFFIQSGRAVKRIVSLQVFNRWGGLMFESQNHATNDSSIGWDGKYNGKNVQSGVYVWQAKVEFLDDEEVDMKGDLVLIR